MMEIYTQLLFIGYLQNSQMAYINIYVDKLNNCKTDDNADSFVDTFDNFENVDNVNNVDKDDNGKPVDLFDIACSN